MDNLDNVELEVVDSRDMALLLRVTAQGNVRLQSNYRPAVVVAMLRKIADQYEARA